MSLYNPLSRTLLIASIMAGSLCCAEDKTLKVYLLTGQSNSLGAVKQDPASAQLLSRYATSGDDAPLYWQRNIASNVPAGESTSWGTVQPAAPAYNGNLCMGPEYGFAYMMQKKGWNIGENSDVAIIKASRDGGGNSNWVKGSAMYDHLLAAVSNALSQVNPSEYSSIEIVGLMYLQGESNNATEADAAAQRYKDLANNLKADIAALQNLPVSVDTSNMTSILGEIATWGGVDNNQTRNNQYNLSQTAASETGIGDVGWVATRDLDKLNPDDGMKVHYNGKAQITIGARYAYEAARQAGIDTGSTRSGNYDKTLDQKEAWMNRQLSVDGTGKIYSVDNVAVWDVASSARENIISSVSGRTLALPGIRIEDSYLDTIVIRGGASGSNPSMADSHLKLGTSGITITSGKNLTLATVLEIDGNQNWDIAGGSTLNIVGSKIDQANAGNNVLTFITGSGNITVSNSTYAANPGSVAKVAAHIHINSTENALSGNWTIGPGVEFTMNGKLAEGKAGSGWGTGSVTLQGATILTHWEQFASNWNNTFILARDTTSAFGSGTNNASSTLTLSGTITGEGALRKTTSNILEISGNNNYAGGTIIEAGSISVKHVNALGSGDVTLKGGSLNLNANSINNKIILAGGSITNLGNTNLLVKIDQTSTLSGTFSLKDGSSVSSGSQMTIAGALTAAGTFTATLSESNLAHGQASLLILNGGSLNLANSGLSLEIDYDSSLLDHGDTLSFQLITNNGGTLSGLDSITDLHLSDRAAKHWTITNFDSGTGSVTLALNSIPEPATATLGLLALAGFFTRRPRQTA